MSTALVIDGAFFLRRMRWSFPDADPADPDDVVDAIWRLTLWHLRRRMTTETLALETARRAGNVHGMSLADSPELYRIFFYDCPPLTKKLHKPVSGQSIDLSKTAAATIRNAIHDELRNTRKVAVRLGRLNDASEWRLTPAATKRLRRGDTAPLTDEDFEIDTKQKGVDMKLGLDVAAMAFKKQVDQIILVAGDADFVPATKLARREGIDVVLDPMGATPAEDLFCHVDGLRTYKKDDT